MKPGMPWSVKGIDQETREAAKDAARRSGMTLGEWLNTMILDQQDEAGGPATSQPEAMAAPPPPPARPKPAPQPEQVRRNDSAIRLEEIAEQLAQLARREQETAAPPRQVYARPAAASEDAAMLQRVLARVESNERQTVEAFSAVNERLAALGRQLMTQAKEPPAASAGEPAALKSLEQAVRNIVEHIELSEKRSRENMRALQERIVDVAAKQAAPAPLPSSPLHDELIASLQSKYQELVGRVERSEQKRTEPQPSELLRGELGQLAERIEQVRATAEQLANRAQTAAVQTSQRELHEIEGRILGVLKEAQTAFGSQNSSAADIQKLRSEIGALNQRIDQMRGGVASERDVAALRTSVEQLQGRVAQAPDMRPLADMDRRLNELARRVEQQQARPQASAELDRRLAEIDSRMKDLARLHAEPRQNPTLERKVTEMADRVAFAESKLSHIDTIERAVNQLFESIDHNRNWAREAAEDAANRMAQKLLNELPRAAASPQNQGHSSELLALEDGLRAVRESAKHADKRNQETLEAVHETLEHIINKLAELETAAVGHQLARATLAPDEPEQHAAPPAWQDDAQLQEASAPEASLSELAAESEESGNIELGVPEQRDDPIPQWQSEIPEPDKVPGQAAADDYIAAARRAALAAAQAGMSAPPILAEPRAKAGFLKGISLGRKRDAAEATAARSPRGMEEPAAAQQGGVRRTLLLAGVVLLMAVGAFWINTRSPAPKNASAIQPSNSQQQEPKQAATQPAAAAQPQAQIILPNDVADSVVTGSVQKPDASLQSLVAEPGTVANQPELPPSDIGTEALRLAARDGNTAAQFIVATRYLDGNGVETDLTQAAHWYQKAAEAGLAPAQYRLATLFERGRGVPKDASTAFIWYKRAAEQGNVKSMHNVAVLAAGNEVGAPNYELAHKWFLAASQHGLKDSQFNLALLYERGLGTAKSPQDALFWYMIAAGNKDQDAAKRVAALSPAMLPETVQAISQKVKTWVPEQGVEAANVVSIRDPAWQDGRASLRRKDKITEEDIAADLDRLRNIGNVSAYSKQTSGRPRDPILADNSIPVLGDAQVGKAQHLLLRLGYDVGQPSGIMDTKTSNAIRLFEFQTRQRVTGRVSDDLLHQLQAYVG
jgi:localization factor PodJL